MNKVILTGRLTRDPESRMTQSNMEISRFSLACQSDFVSRDGERETEFINCVVSGLTDELQGKYLYWLFKTTDKSILYLTSTLYEAKKK